MAPACTTALHLLSVYKCALTSEVTDLGHTTSHIHKVHSRTACGVYAKQCTLEPLHKQAERVQFILSFSPK